MAIRSKILGFGMRFGSALLYLSSALSMTACEDASAEEFEGEEPLEDAEGDDDGLDPSGGKDGDTAGGEGEIPDTEDEQEGAFRVPQASGRFIYAASPMTHRLAIIDSATLVVDVVDVGLEPTVVVPLQVANPLEGAAVVLNEGSDELSIVHTPSVGANRVEHRAITPGANALVVAPTGDYVAAFHDVDLGPVTDGGSDQDLSLVALAPGGARHDLTVGSHPQQLVFAPGGRTAYVVSDDGINVIDMAAVDAGVGGKPALVPATDDAAVDPSRVEVVLAVARGQAVARVDGEPSLFVTDLSSSQQIRFDLPAVPTDIDITPDGAAALLVLPSVAGSRLVQVNLPASGSDSAQSFDLGPDLYVGQVEVAADLSALLLYTGVNPWEGDPGHDDPRQRLTIARPGEGRWDDLVTLFVEFPVRFAGISPDGSTALAVHERDVDHQLWSYTLIDLTQRHPVKKLQRTAADPGSVLFVEDGSRAAVLLRDDQRGVARVDVIDLDNFVVSGHELVGAPTSLGYVSATDRIFIAQEHPAGRISFVDPSGNIETLTGFELNDSIKD